MKRRNVFSIIAGLRKLIQENDAEFFDSSKIVRKLPSGIFLTIDRLRHHVDEEDDYEYHVADLQRLAAWSQHDIDPTLFDGVNVYQCLFGLRYKGREYEVRYAVSINENLIFLTEKTGETVPTQAINEHLEIYQ